MGNIRHNLLNHLNELGWMPQKYAGKPDTVTITAVGDLVAPKTPANVIASNGTERIKIEWDKVTKNFDDSDCNDLSHYNVYYSSSSGIDINDNTTYDGVEARDTLTWSQEVSAGNTKYYVVTAEDDTGNESPASSETSATSQAVTFTVNISDYTDNFSDIQVGDGIIGLIFRQPNSGWDGYSHYKLYRDVIGGSTWTSIFEGPNPAYVDKGVSSGTAYKYKLTFVDVDGGETAGTVRDYSGNGYDPSNGNNSNITAQTFLAPNIVAQNEVRGNSLYAESKIVLGGVDNTGYIKSSSYNGTTIGSDTTDGFLITAGGGAEFNDVTVRGEVDINGSLGGSDISNILSISGTIEGNYSVGSTGWQINGAGSAEFNNVTVRGTVEISGGSGIANLTDAGDLATKNAALVSAGDIVIDGALQVTGNIYCALNNVQLGQNVGPNNIDGISVQSGGKIEVTDTSGRTIFDSSGKFWGAPQLANMTASRSNDLVSGSSFRTIISTSGASSVNIYGGIVTAEVETYAEAGNCYVRITDDTSFEDIYAAFGSFRYQTYNVGNPAIIIPIPAFQSKGDVTIKYYNADNNNRYAQWQISYQTQ